MTNIYAAVGMQEDAERIEAMWLKYADWSNQGHHGLMQVETSGNMVCKDELYFHNVCSLDGN